MQYAQVLVNVPFSTHQGGFDFAIAEPMQAPVAGNLVIVPWANGAKVGIVSACGNSTSIAPERVRPITGVVTQWPALPGPVLALADFAARYYHASAGEVLLSSIPETLTRAADYVVTDGEAVRAIRKRTAAVPIPERMPGQIAERVLTPAQQQHLVWLSEQLRRPDGFAVGLLYGVTGSGKTELYLRGVAEVLAQGKTALLLVPEIALTEGLAAQVSARFGHEQVAIMTSGIAEGARARAWLAALTGQARIVIGTRSAVFAPLSNLGLIVVDEEHDASYKQHEGARVHARDLAVMRARLSACPILLGSATPSLESWSNAQQGRYTLLRMPQRAHAEAVLPRIALVDGKAAGQVHGLSEPLASALKLRVERKEQSLMFINRRGYSPALTCQACDWVADCDNCSAHLALHRAGSHQGYKLICHHCSAQRPVPRACPACGNKDLLAQGQGTQKLEENLALIVSGARIVRMDRDTTRRRGSGKQILDAMDEGRIDVLVGTQMIAKGHDFERLTLVGVAGADSLLVSPDFRAEERLFALLMQVAGRAGRADKPGEVMIQTRQPNHPLFRELLVQDYEAAATRLLAEREELGLPPYTALAVLRAQAPSDTAAQGFLTDARQLANQDAETPAVPTAPGIRLYHPRPMAVPRVANTARWQLLIEGTTRAGLQSFLRTWLPEVGKLKAARTRWHIDVDPLDV